MRPLFALGDPKGELPGPDETAPALSFGDRLLSFCEGGSLLMVRQSRAVQRKGKKENAQGSDKRYRQ